MPIKLSVAETPVARMKAMTQNVDNYKAVIATWSRGLLIKSPETIGKVSKYCATDKTKSFGNIDTLNTKGL